MTETTKTPADVSVTFLTAAGVECAIDENPAAMRLTFGDGEVSLVTEHELRACSTALLFHGAKAKFIDAAAIPRDKATGKSATIAQKREAVQATIDRVIAGEWNKAREGGDGAANGLLYTAMCRMYEGVMDAAAMRTWLDAKTTEEKAALRINPQIAAIIIEIKAERAPKSTADSDALLAGLPSLPKA